MASRDEALSHLVIPEILAEAIHAMSDDELDAFFASLKIPEHRRIETAKSAEELTTIQNNCKMLTKLRSTFGLIRQAVRNRSQE